MVRDADPTAEQRAVPDARGGRGYNAGEAIAMATSLYYPIFVHVEGAAVLVVGGGVLAEAKARAMLDHGARVRLVWPEVTPSLRGWTEQGRLEWRARDFEERDLADCRLVFCATGEDALNRRVSEAAQRSGIPVNVVDVPELCTFIVPSILRRGNLAVAVSTDGRCPSYSRYLREKLETRIDESYGKALEVLEEVREQVYAAFADRDYETRREIMEDVLALNVPLLIRNQGADAAREAAMKIVRGFLRQ